MEPDAGQQSVRKKKYSLTLVIPTDVVGLLIGKQGATLREISAASGAKMSFQAFSDMPPRTKERCVVIWGPIEAIVAAVGLVLAKMEVRRPRSDGDGVMTENGKYLLKWLIPNYMCGLLIGRHGEGIKQINEASGAWVKVAHVQESAPGATERMIYISGSKEDNAAALQLVIQKVGGRPFSEKATEAPLDPAHESCLHMPPAAASTVLAMGPQQFEVQNMLKLHGVSLQTSLCNAVGGQTNLRLVISGPEVGRSAVLAYLASALMMWRAAGSIERDLQGGSILDSYTPECLTNKISGNVGTSLKMTIPRKMFAHVLGSGHESAREIAQKTDSSVYVTSFISPSIELDLVVVVLGGDTLNILQALTVLLTRMVQSKTPMPRLPVQLSNNINASAGGISSSTVQNGRGLQQSVSSPRSSEDEIQLKQIELQLQALQQQKDTFLKATANRRTAAPICAPLPPGPHPASQNQVLFTATAPHRGVTSTPMSQMEGARIPVYMPVVGAGGVVGHPVFQAPPIMYAQTAIGLQPVIYGATPPSQNIGAPLEQQFAYLPQGGMGGQVMYTGVLPDSSQSPPPVIPMKHSDSAGSLKVTGTGPPQHQTANHTSKKDAPVFLELASGVEADISSPPSTLNAAASVYNHSSVSGDEKISQTHYVTSPPVPTTLSPMTSYASGAYVSRGSADDYSLFDEHVRKLTDSPVSPLTATSALTDPYMFPSQLGVHTSWSAAQANYREQRQAGPSLSRSISKGLRSQTSRDRHRR